MYRQGNPGTMQGRPNTNGLYSPGPAQAQRFGGNPMMAQNQQNPYRGPPMMQNPAMMNRSMSPMRGQYQPQPAMHRPGGGNPVLNLVKQKIIGGLPSISSPLDIAKVKTVMYAYLKQGIHHEFAYGQRSKYYMNVGPGKTWGYSY